MPRMALGVLLRLGPVLGDLDPAGLAASADLHLGLDHAGIADLLRGLDGRIDGVGDPAFGYWNPVAGEELLSLIFEEIQGPREVIRAFAACRGVSSG